jgi:Glycosyl transferase family group 2
VVLVVDADCVISPGALTLVAQRCAATQCPVQMLDLMVAPEGAGLRTRILEFAWRVKNQVRPKGTFRLGGACHLMGTGMALPWALISQANLATGHIAEDMKLGVDLTIAGHPTQFLETVQITSEFPLNSDVARTQKARWEHGHLRTLSEELPRIVGAMLRRPRRSLLVLGMDLVIPPLALYFLTVVLSLPVAALANWLSPAFAPVLQVCVAGALMLTAAVAWAWVRFARDLLSLRELATAPLYALWKIPVYLAYFMNRKSGWVKTQRKI